MSTPFHVLLPTDVFPPRCGGAGWSAHALALALQSRGHAVTALVPQAGASGITRETVGGVPTVRFGYRVGRLPFVKNATRHEWLWPRLADELVRLAQEQFPLPVVLHAQHVQTAPAAVLAGQRLGAPVAVTVRDHWPWDYFATGLHGDRVPYPRQTIASLATDALARVGAVRGTLALPAIPYMLAHLRRRQQFLRQANAVVAVSGYIAGRLAGIVPPERVHVISNMLDIAAIDRTVAEPPHETPIDGSFVLFVGKLERNKGAQLLVDVFRSLKQHEEPLPTLVICGDGALRPYLERELGALGVRLHMLDWLAHDDVLRLMARCDLLLFPSAWGEPLSRVLLEASACAAPILAMPTGGTPDIISDGETGALAATPESFARRMRQLLANRAERQRLGAAARQRALERWNVPQVIGQVERLYAGLRVGE